MDVPVFTDQQELTCNSSIDTECSLGAMDDKDEW